MAHVRLDHVIFNYPVFHVAGRSLKLQVMRRIIGGPSGVLEVEAIRGVSLNLRDGDRLGLRSQPRLRSHQRALPDVRR